MYQLWRGRRYDDSKSAISLALSTHQAWSEIGSDRFRLFVMKLISGLLAFTLIARQAIAVAVHNVDLEARGDSCSPFVVNIVYDILKALHASPFCTSWLAISTVTVTGGFRIACGS